jgi:hypothetical protein
MRLLLTLASLAASGYGLWWVNETHPELKTKVQEFISSGSFPTLEVRYTAAQIMESHRRDLLKDSRHRFLEPQLKFYPYLLMEVKYNLSEEKTREGVILWDLLDGEMVVETKAWEKTHGFGDCITAGTQRHEFKILNILAKKGGAIDREGLSKALHVENETLDLWLESCRRKKLIVQSGNKYRLHLQNPHLRATPETKLDHKLVTMPNKGASRLPRRYSLGQIERLTKAAFGNDFAIRKTTDVYLPVHCIVVQNPDGSIHTSHWNALNGKQLLNSHFID